MLRAREPAAAVTGNGSSGGGGSGMRSTRSTCDHSGVEVCTDTAWELEIFRPHTHLADSIYAITRERARREFNRDEEQAHVAAPAVWLPVFGTKAPRGFGFHQAAVGLPIGMDLVVCP